MKSVLNENATCHVARHLARPLPAVRVVPRSTNRAYLRALRAAEMAAWQEPAPRPARPPRLPAPTRSTAEGRLFAVLSALALGSVLHGLLTSGEFVLRWDRLVALVRQLLG